MRTFLSKDSLISSPLASQSRSSINTHYTILVLLILLLISLLLRYAQRISRAGEAGIIALAVMGARRIFFSRGGQFRGLGDSSSKPWWGLGVKLQLTMCFENNA